jgi:6-phosphogluconolactonase (cycloisomerase 2 family)
MVSIARALGLALFCSLVVAACGGDSGSTRASYTVGGTIGGLVGSGLMLQDNAGNDLAVSTNGIFTFTMPVANGTGYSVTVKTQPASPTQNCDISDGSGLVSGTDVTSVSVTCTTNGYTVGGTVSGLVGTGSGLVLADNNGDELSVSASGSFTFPLTIGSGTHYAVTVKSQPTNPAQTCSITNGSGTIAGANVASVAVTCATDFYQVTGSVSGLAAGDTVVLQTTGAGAVSVSSNGTFVLATLAEGTPYTVSVSTQPATPAQTCLVANPTGSIGTANATVSVTCTNNNFAVGGTVTGLMGSGLVLQTTGVNVPIAAGSTSYSTSLANGTPYTFSVATQPINPSQTCAIANPSGTVSSAPITNVNVTCTPNTYAISGQITGLAGSGMVLQDNASNNLTITANGLFSFTNKIASGAPYAVTVLTQPTKPPQTCVVTNGAGTVAAAPVINVSIACTTNTGRFAYVTDTNDGANGSVSYFTIAVSNGALALGTGSPYPSPAGAQPTAIAVDPTGQFVYVGNVGSSNISTYTVDPTTGALTSTGTVPTGAGSVPEAVAIDPSGQFFYVADEGNNVVLAYTIDAVTGALTAVGAPIGAGSLPDSIIVDPSGRFVYVTNIGDRTVSAYSIDASSGALTPVPGSPIVSGNEPNALAVDPLYQYLFVSNIGDGTVSGFAIDGSSGALATLSGSPFPVGSAPGSLTVDSSGTLLYVANSGDGTLSGFQISTTTGNLSALAGSPFVTGGGEPLAVVIDPSNQFLYVTNGAAPNANSISAFTMLSTGALTPVPGSPFDSDGALPSSIVIE